MRCDDNYDKTQGIGFWKSCLKEIGPSENLSQEKKKSHLTAFKDL